MPWILVRSGAVRLVVLWGFVGDILVYCVLVLQITVSFSLLLVIQKFIRSLIFLYLGSVLFLSFLVAVSILFG